MEGETGAPCEEGAVEVRAIAVSPEISAVDAPLTLRVSFALAAPLKAAAWRVAYTVDVAGRQQRHVIELGGSEGEADLEAGAHEWEHTVERMDVKAAGVKPKHLLRNVGLLSASLAAAGADGGRREDVLEIRLVTQVAKGADGSLVRTVFNPLE